MVPLRKIAVSVNGAICNGRNCIAGLVKDTVLLNPPPVRGAVITVIYKAKGQPFEEIFTGTGAKTTFQLRYEPE